MHPVDCPAFDYSKHPKRSEVLRTRATGLIRALRLRDDAYRTSIAQDSRPAHEVLFRELTQPGYEYFAGHYRGEPFRCLQYYSVQIKSDSRVGFAPHLVKGFVRELADEIAAGLAALDVSHQLPDTRLSPADKLLYTVIFTCRVFEFFLRVHPFADGNGHAARFIVWAMLGRYGYWPRVWPIEPRPADPPYSEFIRRYRDGDCEPLEKFVLQCIHG